MNKLKLLKAVNALLFISLAIQIATVFVISFKIKFPNVRAVFEIHEYNGFLMIALVAAHITLNWGWVKANFFGKKNR